MGRVAGGEQDDAVVETIGKGLRKAQLLSDGETSIRWSRKVRTRATEVRE